MPKDSYLDWDPTRKLSANLLFKSDIPGNALTREKKAAQCYRLLKDYYLFSPEEIQAIEGITGIDGTLLYLCWQKGHSKGANTDKKLSRLASTSGIGEQRLQQCREEYRDGIDFLALLEQEIDERRAFNLQNWQQRGGKTKNSDWLQVMRLEVYKAQFVGFIDKFIKELPTLLLADCPELLDREKKSKKKRAELSERKKSGELKDIVEIFIQSFPGFFDDDALYVLASCTSDGFKTQYLKNKILNEWHKLSLPKQAEMFFDVAESKNSSFSIDGSRIRKKSTEDCYELYLAVLLNNPVSGVFSSEKIAILKDFFNYHINNRRDMKKPEGPMMDSELVREGRAGLMLDKNFIFELENKCRFVLGMKSCSHLLSRHRKKTKKTGRRIITLNLNMTSLSDKVVEDCGGVVFSVDNPDKETIITLNDLRTKYDRMLLLCGKIGFPDYLKNDIIHFNLFFKALEDISKNFGFYFSVDGTDYGRLTCIQSFWDGVAKEKLSGLAEMLLSLERVLSQGLFSEENKRHLDEVYFAINEEDIGKTKEKLLCFLLLIYEVKLEVLLPIRDSSPPKYLAPGNQGWRRQLVKDVCRQIKEFGLVSSSAATIRRLIEKTALPKPTEHYARDDMANDLQTSMMTFNRTLVEESDHEYFSNGDIIGEEDEREEILKQLAELVKVKRILFLGALRTFITFGKECKQKDGESRIAMFGKTISLTARTRDMLFGDARSMGDALSGLVINLQHQNEKYQRGYVKLESDVLRRFDNNFSEGKDSIITKLQQLVYNGFKDDYKAVDESQEPLLSGCDEIQEDSKKEIKEFIKEHSFFSAIVISINEPLLRNNTKFNGLIEGIIKRLQAEQTELSEFVSLTRDATQATKFIANFATFKC